MSSEKITMPANPTQEQIEEVKKQVKAKYGESCDVFVYEADGSKGYLRSIDRATYSAAASQVSKSPAKFNDVVLENIWLGGDEVLRKDDRYYFGLIDYVEELMAKKKGSLTTL